MYGVGKWCIARNNAWVMMKGLETGKDKIQKICDMLKHETLEPAKQEALELIENAHLQAKEILQVAQKKADELICVAKAEVEERGRVFHASLQFSCRQALGLLKQKIEEQLFCHQLSDLVLKETADPHVIAHIIDSFMKELGEKGLEEEFVAIIPKQISPRSINSLLGAQILERLQKQTVVLGDFAGGVQIQLKNKQVTIDISDETIKDLVSQYIRNDFREMFFNS